MPQTPLDLRPVEQPQLLSGPSTGGLDLRPVEGAQTDTGPSIIQRAIKNAPRSLMNLIQNIPGVPGTGQPNVRADPQTHQLLEVMPDGSTRPFSVNPIAGISQGIGGLVGTLMHPAESFAEDPFGTAAIPAGVIAGGIAGLRSAPGRAAIAAGGRDTALGALRTAGGLALAKSGPFGELGDILGGLYITKGGIKQMGRGIGAGYNAAKGAIKIGEPAPNPYFAGSSTGEPAATAPVLSAPPGYQPPVSGALPGSAPVGAAAPAAAGAEDMALLNDIALGQLKKPFARLSPSDQQSVRGIAAAMRPESPTLAPPPGMAGVSFESPVDTSQVPTHAADPFAGKKAFKGHTLPMTDLLQQFHKQWGNVSARDITSSVYGTPKGTMPTYDQLSTIHEWMLTHNGKIPGPGDIK